MDLGLRFTTQRLSIHSLNAADIPTLFDVYADPKVITWVDDGQPITLEECYRWYDVTLANYAKFGYGMFSIRLAEYQECIGFIGLVHPNGCKTPEVKYALKPQYWGMGYASEAVTGIINYAYLQKGITKLKATVAEENMASQSVLIKAKMFPASDYCELDGGITKVFLWNVDSKMEAQSILQS